MKTTCRASRPRRPRPLRASAAFVVLALCFFVSCQRYIGYGTILWRDDEHNLPEGTIVRILLRSNISQVYVVELPDTQERAELPLWTVSEPSSRRAAEELNARYAEYAGQYASCALDGLPIREEPENLSSQVYRLRENEVIRPLYKVEGVAPTSGGVPLEGDWLRVLAEGGTQGYCFSHNLRFFRPDEVAASGDGGDAAEFARDEVLEAALSTTWYPDYYRSMISGNQIDLEFFTTSYGFDTGYSSGTTTLSLPGVHASFPYSTFIKQENGDYREQDAPIEMSVRNSNFIVVRYTDDSGRPRAFNFVTLPGTDSAQTIIEREQDRRDQAYRAIQSAGPDFRSASYGTLTFGGDNGFSWRRFNRLQPSVIPSGVRGEGTVEFKYFLPSNLASSWDGVITFVFDDVEGEVNFLYRRDESSLRLSYATVTTRQQGNTGLYAKVVSLPMNPIVLYFAR